MSEYKQYNELKIKNNILTTSVNERNYITIPLSGSRSGTSFLAMEQPFQDVGKENRRKVGAYFFDLYVCILSESSQLATCASV